MIREEKILTTEEYLLAVDFFAKLREQIGEKDMLRERDAIFSILTEMVANCKERGGSVKKLFGDEDFLSLVILSYHAHEIKQVLKYRHTKEDY